MYKCSICVREFVNKSALSRHINLTHGENSTNNKRLTAKSFIRETAPTSLYDVSSRTAKKILSRMKVGCSNCAWSEATCDIHHIIERKHGGGNEHSNLTLLCPNCHRLAHNGKLKEFVTLEFQIRDEWKNYYYSSIKHSDV